MKVLSWTTIYCFLLLLLLREKERRASNRVRVKLEVDEALELARAIGIRATDCGVSGEHCPTATSISGVDEAMAAIVSAGRRRKNWTTRPLDDRRGRCGRRVDDDIEKRERRPRVEFWTSIESADASFSFPSCLWTKKILAAIWSGAWFSCGGDDDVSPICGIS